MITKMRKVTALVYHREYEAFLDRLQELGVVHIELSQQGAPDQDSALQYIINERARVQKTLDHLQTLVEDEVMPTPLSSNEQGKELMSRYEANMQALDAQRKEVKRLQEAVKVATPWGNYALDSVQTLLKTGYEMTYWSCSEKRFPTLAATEGNYLFPISEENGKTYFVAFARKGERPNVADARQQQAPLIPLAEATQSLSQAQEKEQQLQADIQSFAEHELPHLLTYHESLCSSIQFAEVELRTQRVAANHLMLLEGWMPFDKEQDVQNYLKQTGAYYELRDPQEGDNVPIKFKNNSYAALFERLTRMYGFPNYDEWDPTPFVAPFFMLFFAICMGDAGYGVLIILYGLLEMAGKARKTPILGEMLAGCGGLVTVLGVATLFVGIALGSFFGLNIADLSGLPEGIKDYYALVQGTFPGTTYSFQMVGAILIGVLHICIALTVKAIVFTKKEGIKAHLSTWGWNLLIIGSVVVGTLALMGTFDQQTTVYILMGIGCVSAVGIFLLNNVARLQESPLKGILLNPLAGIYDTYNVLSGLMGDVLSYIRLYALCLAGGMLGAAFNSIGAMLSDAFTGGVVLTAIICIIGHLLNLLLSAISAFVHPLRLTFVEYFKNAGYEGKGTGYKPFKK